MLQSLFKATSLVVLLRVGGIALQLLWFVLLVRMLPIEAVGVYSAINGAWVLLRALGPMGGDTAFIREGSALVGKQEFSRARGILHAGMRHAAGPVAIVFLLIGMVAYVVAPSFPMLQIETVLIALAGGAAYVLFGFYSASLLALEKQVAAHALESLVLPVIVIIVASGLHDAGQLDLKTLIMMQSSIALLIAAAYWCINCYCYGGDVAQASREEKKEFSALSWRLFGTVAFNNINVRLPVVVSPLLVGAAGAALLEAALRFASLLGVIQWCASFVIAPKLPKANAKQSLDVLQDLLVIGCWIVFVPGLILFLTLVFAGQPLLHIVAGHQYIPAYIPMIILAAGFLINTASGPTTHFYTMLGHEKSALRISMTETVVSMMLIVLLGSYVGVHGIAVAMALGISLRNLLLNYKLENMTGLYSAVWSLRGWRKAGKVIVKRK